MNTTSTSGIGKRPSGSGKRPPAVWSRRNGARCGATLVAIAAAALIGYAGSAMAAGIVSDSHAAALQIQTDDGRVVNLERVALVIGNDTYNNYQNLQSSRTGARAVADAFRRLGFVVVHHEDAGHVEMLRGLLEFTGMAQSARIAVVFYTGHGYVAGQERSAPDGRNFLVPVDADLGAATDATDATEGLSVATDVDHPLIPVDWVMRSVEGASDLRLVILDADVPAPLEPTGNTLVALAAKEGTFSQDGSGDSSSPYTGALLRYLDLLPYLEEPGLDVGTLFDLVRAEVMRSTDGGQEPVLRGRSPEGAYLYPISNVPGGSGRPFRDCPECPELVVVPSGSFEMGSPPEESGRYDDEEPVHEVRLGYRLAVGVKEVTRGEYGRFVSATGYPSGDSCNTYEDGEWERSSGRDWRNPGFPQTDDHPVVCVSWGDAKAYVGWLSRETGEEYRLLSEAEWEYMARGGTETARYWGESEAGQCRYANGAGMEAKRHESGWTTVDCDDGHFRTSPVGSFAPNEFGLHDMLGNVWEWVEDCGNDDYHGAPGDGSAWKSGDCDVNILRGGSWVDSPRSLRSAVRLWKSSGARDSDYGFRVARTLTPNTTEEAPAR